MTPFSIIGSGNATLQFGGDPLNISLDNKDSSNDMNVKINGDPTGVTIEASGKRGFRIRKKIYDVIITATGNWEVTVV